MAEEKSSNNLLILIGIGIVLGAAFVYSELRKQQLIQAQVQAAYTQAFAQQTQYLNDLNSTVKRLEGQVQVVQTLQPLKLLEPQLMESLKSLEPLKPMTVVEEAPARAQETYKNNESWEFKRGPDQIITIGEKTITIPGKLQGINVIRNAKGSAT